VLTAGAVEVPAPALLLDRVAVDERVRVALAVVVKLDLDEAVRLVADGQPATVEESVGEGGEPGIHRRMVTGLARPLAQGTPTRHRASLRCSTRKGADHPPSTPHARRRPSAAA